MTRKTLFILLGLAVVLGILTGGLFSKLTNLPDISTLETYRPSQVSRIFADDGTLIEELFLEKREIVPFDRIPLYLRQAVIAVEDSRFYSHHGIDFRGIARALLKDIVAARVVQGGSTITQQLSKVLFFTSKRTLIRKIKEAILTLQIEQRYTKDQILNLYLNQIYLGAGCYGVQTASKRYFGKDVSQITVAEAALLAALPKSPGRYSPLANPEEAKARRDLVLDRMVAQGYLSEEEAAKAETEPVSPRPRQEFSQKAPYFVEAVIQQITSRFGKEKLYQGGLSIHTTLDVHLQRIAQKTLRQGLDAIMAREGDAKTAPELQGAMIVLDPHNGQIKALVGGYDYTQSQFNRALQAKRQPGSAFKPVIFAAALKAGYQPSDLLMDTPFTYTDPHTMKTWTPQNFDREFRGEVTLRQALEESLNVPTVRLLQEVGIDKSIALAKNLGIQSRLKPYLSLALGASEVTLDELTAAYATFAAQGIYSHPMMIRGINDDQGRALEEDQPERKIALDEGTAFLITYLLEGVSQSGTGRIALALHRPVATKTGTTDDYSDAWFVGYTPELVVGVWVGYDDRRPIGPGETGARAAGPIWVAFMKEALKNRAPTYFPVPPSIVFRKIDPHTGQPATPDTTEVIEEAFRK
jgi:penicillin-binding protein 1A